MADTSQPTIPDEMRELGRRDARLGMPVTHIDVPGAQMGEQEREWWREGWRSVEKPRRQRARWQPAWDEVLRYE